MNNFFDRHGEHPVLVMSQMFMISLVSLAYAATHITLEILCDIPARIRGLQQGKKVSDR